MAYEIAPEVDFTSRTHAELRARGLTLLEQRLGTYRYNAWIATDVVPAIIDVMAWYMEQSAHYGDRRRINAHLSTADTRDDAVVITRSYGYRMRPATSASVSVQAIPNPPQNVPVTLRRGSRISVSGLTFEVAADAIIPAGATVWPDGTTDDIIVLSEGGTRTDTLQSDGSDFQEFELGMAGVIDGSVEVEILGIVWEPVDSLVYIEGDRRGRDTFSGTGADSQQVTLSLLHAVVGHDDDDGLLVIVTPAGLPYTSGRVWQQVEAFTGAPYEFTASQAADGTTVLKFGLAANLAAPGNGDVIDVHYVLAGSQRRYQLTYDREDRATIRFGDGRFGNIPPAGASITVTYRVGGGAQGNVPVGTIDKVISGYMPSGARTPVRIINIEAGRGGEPQETLDHARYYAPRVLKANDRAVTREDWTAFASTFTDPYYGAPSHASAYLKQSIPELNTVQIAVWGRDETGRLAESSTPLNRAIEKYLDTKRTITTVAEAINGVVVFFDMDISVELETGKAQQTVFTNVREAIETFFASSFVRPGVDLSVSRLYAAIQNAEGVARAEINTITGAILAVVELGNGDGSVKSFSGNVEVGDGLTVLPGSVVVSDGTQQALDDAEGAFVGDGVGTVDYTSGVFSVTLSSPPGAGVRVYAEAKVAAFFPYIESFVSDGTFSSIDGGTVHYPIVKRKPVGIWSGDRVKVIDGFRLGSSNQFRGQLGAGVDSLSLSVYDSSPVPATVSFDALGVASGAAYGSVDHDSGLLDITFTAAFQLPLRAVWTTKTMDLYLPASFLPLPAGRVFFWGGYNADGAQPGSASYAADDGDGSVFGHVASGGTISVETGRVRAEWVSVPSPGPSGGATLVGVLSPLPDGVTRQFDFTVVAATGLTSPVDISVGGLDGQGRTRLQLSDLSSVGISLDDAYDNWQGDVHGDSLDPEGVNTIDYAGTGTLTFLVAPAAGVSVPGLAVGEFFIQITNVVMAMRSGWVYRVKTPGSPGLDHGLFADNNGRFWGASGVAAVNSYPTDGLDHDRGRYHATLAAGTVPAGRTPEITYDAMTGVPPTLDVPIAGDEVAALGKISITEKAPEIPNE